MTTSDLFDPPEARPISSAGGSPASPSRSPGSRLARRMTVTSGRKCAELLKLSGPLGSLVRTLLVSSTWNSTAVFLTWRPSATPARRSLFRLVPRTPHTDEIESGLWVTPCAMDANPVTGGDLYQTSTGSVRARLPDGRTSNRGLEAQVLFPTAQARDFKGSSGRSLKGEELDLPTAVKLWPTPTTQDASNNGGPSQSERNSLPLNAIVGGSLNPQWVEWLMGYPEGWTDLGD